MGRSVIRQLVRAKTTLNVAALITLAALSASLSYADGLSTEPSKLTALRFLAALQSGDRSVLGEILSSDAAGKFWIESDNLTIWQTIDRSELLTKMPILDAWRCPFALTSIEEQTPEEPALANFACQKPYPSKHLATKVLGVRLYFTIDKTKQKVLNVWVEWRVPNDVHVPLEP